MSCWDNNIESRFGFRELRAPRPGEQWYVTAIPAPRAASAAGGNVGGAPTAIAVDTVVLGSPAPPRRAAADSAVAGGTARP